VVMRQHNVWCVHVRSVWRGMPESSPAYLSTQNAPWRWSEWWSKHVGGFRGVFNM